MRRILCSLDVLVWGKGWYGNDRLSTIEERISSNIVNLWRKWANRPLTFFRAKVVAKLREDVWHSEFVNQSSMFLHVLMWGWPWLGMLGCFQALFYDSIHFYVYGFLWFEKWYVLLLRAWLGHSVCVTLCLCPCGRHWEPWLLWTDQLQNLYACGDCGPCQFVDHDFGPFGNLIYGDSKYLIWFWIGNLNSIWSNYQTAPSALCSNSACSKFVEINKSMYILYIRYIHGHNNKAWWSWHHVTMNPSMIYLMYYTVHISRKKSPSFRFRPFGLSAVWLRS